MSPFHIGPTSRYTRFMVHLPSPAGKGQHGRSQRGTWARKPLVRGISLKVAPLAETLLLGGHTSAPPNNPLILRYFGAFWVAESSLLQNLGAAKPPKIKRFNPEHNAVSKIAVRKLQEKGN